MEDKVVIIDDCAEQKNYLNQKSEGLYQNELLRQN